MRQSELPEQQTDLRRRRMLARLGLVATAAYVSPILLNIGTASASTRPSKPSRPSRPSLPSRPSRPSRFSRPSRLSRPGYL